MAHWREKVDPKLRPHLETQIAETGREKDAYMNAEDPANAQLWIAVANLARQCFELNVKIGNIDTALRDSLVQHQAALERLIAERLKPKSPKRKNAKAKPAARRVRKAKKASKAVRSARATAAATAKKVAEKVAKETAKRSARATAAVTARKVARKVVTKAKVTRRAKPKKKKNYVLLKEV